MTDRERDVDHEARETADAGGAGDVESAGETTAAASAPTGDANAKPVGEGTRVKVAGDEGADD